MPSSSARCSQLPRAVDKVPFYLALKKLRDHLNGKIPHVDDSEITFPDLELKVIPKAERVQNEDMSPDVEGAPKSKRKRRKKDNDNTNRSPPFGPGMGPFMPGAWSGQLSQVKQEPGMNTACPVSQAGMWNMQPPNSMSSLFANGPPTLVKQEDLSDLAAFGITPNSFMGMPPHLVPSPPASFPSGMNGYSGSGMPSTGFMGGAGSFSTQPQLHMVAPMQGSPSSSLSHHGMSGNNSNSSSNSHSPNFHHSPTGPSRSSAYPTQSCQSSSMQVVPPGGSTGGYPHGTPPQNHSPNFSGSHTSPYWQQHQQHHHHHHHRHHQQQQQQQQTYNNMGGSPPHSQGMTFNPNFNSQSSSGGNYSGPGPSSN